MPQRRTSYLPDGLSFPPAGVPPLPLVVSKQPPSDRSSYYLLTMTKRGFRPWQRAQRPPAAQCSKSDRQRPVPSLFQNERGRQLKRPYFLSSDQDCSPHSHLNMRTVRPLWELSIVRTSEGFLPQRLHARTGLGSKLEKISFLNSLFMMRCPATEHDLDKLQSEQLFPSG
jgi:hypothetical protein